MFNHELLLSRNSTILLHERAQFVFNSPNFDTIIFSCDARLAPNVRQLKTNYYSGGISFKPLFTQLYKWTNVLFPAVYAASTGAIESEKALTAVESRKERIRELLSKETKYDRIRRMYSLNEFGIFSPEIRYVLNVAYMSFGVGAVWGLLTFSSKARADFMRKNVETPFETEYLARRQLYDKMILTGARGGFIRGIKLTICTTTYVLVATTVATYNNKITIFEHIAAGAVMGAFYKLNYGLKGMASAGALGGFLGTFAGGAILLILKLSGTTYEEMRYMQHEFYAPEIKAKLSVKHELKKLENP